METLGGRLERLMGEAGLNQTTLAEKTGIDRTEVNRVLNGKRQPRPEHLGYYAAVLGVTLDELLDGVSLPDKAREVVLELQEIAARLLEAERERDALKDEVATLREGNEERRQAFEASLQSLERELAEERQTHAKELFGLRAERGELVMEVEKLRSHVASLTQAVQKREGEVARERSAKVGTAVIAGIAGVILGSSGSR